MLSLATTTIGAIDLAIVCVYLLVTTLLGVWLGRGQRDTKDFFLGNNQLPAWALLLSLVATETSVATFLSVPGMAFKESGNFALTQLAIGYIVGRLLVWKIILPIHMARQHATAYASLEDTFGLSTRRLASVAFLLARTAGDGLRLFLTALALHQACGWSIEICVLVIASVTALYSLAGGVKSVVWNDCLQFAIYMSGAVVAAWLIVSRLPGGVGQYLSFVAETGRSQTFITAWNPADGSITIWSGLLGGAILSLATHGADHLMVQRYLCARNKRSAAAALLLSGPLVLLQFVLFLAIGAGIACYFQQFDPARLTLAGDQAFASFIVEDMGTPLRGLILAAIFAAAMSTLSSSVNASAGSLLEDLCGSTYRNTSPGHALLLARAFTLFFTALQAVVAIGAYHWLFKSSELSVVESVLAIAGLAAGLMLGLFFLQIVCGSMPAPLANVAIVTGAIAVLTCFATEVTTKWWLPAISSATTFGVGWLLNAITITNTPTTQGDSP